MAGQNKGYFIPTTQNFDAQAIMEEDVNSLKFKEIIVKLYQFTNQISQSVNSKASGYYNTQEFASGEMFYPNPSLSSTSVQKTFAAPRPVFKKVINFGTLPSSTSGSSVAHGITFGTNTTLVRLWGAATNTAGTSMIPLPYASATLNENISLYADGTNVYIKPGIDRSAYTKCNIIIEYLKN